MFFKRLREARADVTFLREAVEAEKKSVTSITQMFLEEQRMRRDAEKKIENLNVELYKMTELHSRAVIRRSEAEQDRDKWKNALVEANYEIDKRDEYWGPLCKQITLLLQPGLEDFYTNTTDPAPWDKE